MDKENDIEYRLKRLEIYVRYLILFSNIPAEYLQKLDKEINQLLE